MFSHNHGNVTTVIFFPFMKAISNASNKQCNIIKKLEFAGLALSDPTEYRC